jgi:hypothetical protein
MYRGTAARVATCLSLLQIQPHQRRVHAMGDAAPRVSVMYGNAEEFERKKQRLRAGGPKALHIISDFDFTLTKVCGRTSLYAGGCTCVYG